MECGPDDLVMLGIRLLRSLPLVVIIYSAIAVGIVLGVRRWPKLASQKMPFAILILLPIVCWMIYSLANLELDYTLTLLNSESSQVAEHTYDNRFKRQVKTIEQAIALAVNGNEAPNVRFYASCLVADMLVSNDEPFVTKVLKETENAPLIETQFFGGNRLTAGFYVPGHDQVHIYPSDLIRQRLRM